jgi:hypothetical protein
MFGHVLNSAVAERQALPQRPSKPVELSPSRHKQSTVHVYRLTGDIGSIVRGQKCHQAGDVLGFADSFERNIVDPFLHELTRLVVTQKFAPGACRI